MYLGIVIYITGICYVYGILSWPRLRFSFALRQCKYKGALVCAPLYIQES
jgi:hypothetical protein